MVLLVLGWLAHLISLRTGKAVAQKCALVRSCEISWYFDCFRNHSTIPCFIQGFEKKNNKIHYWLVSKYIPGAVCTGLPQSTFQIIGLYPNHRSQFPSLWWFYEFIWWATGSEKIKFSSCKGCQRSPNVIGHWHHFLPFYKCRKYLLHPPVSVLIYYLVSIYSSENVKILTSILSCCSRKFSMVYFR